MRCPAPLEGRGLIQRVVLCTKAQGTENRLAALCAEASGVVLCLGLVALLNSKVCLVWRTPSPRRGGGDQRPKKSLCASNRPQMSGPFDKFHFLPEKNFSDLGGWVGRGWPGPQTTPPPPGSLSNGVVESYSSFDGCVAVRQGVCVCVCVCVGFCSMTAWHKC